MDQPATAAMPCHGFEATVYTLFVGKDRRRLNVQGDVLARIPSLKTKLMDGEPELDQDTQYFLKDDDLKAVATVLAFVRDGFLPESDGKFQKADDLASIDRQIHHFILAYVFALDYDLEAAQNAILDRTCLLLRERIRDGAMVRINMNLNDGFYVSWMYGLLCRELAYQLQLKAQEQSEPTLSSDYDILDEATEGFDRDIFFSLAAHLLRPIEESPLEEAIRNPCMYHVHVNTETCDKTILEESDDTKSSSSQETVNDVEVTETTDKENGGEKTPSVPGSKIASLRQIQTQSNEPHTETSTSPSQSLNPTETNALGQRRSRPAGNNEIAASSHDSNNAESGYTLVKGKRRKMTTRIYNRFEDETDDEESEIQLTDTPSPTLPAISAIQQPVPQRRALFVRSDVSNAS